MNQLMLIFAMGIVIGISLEYLKLKLPLKMVLVIITLIGGVIL